MSERYSSKNFDHLGIVSVICDEIGLKEKVDQFIPPDEQMAITFGECLKLMVINGLGFTSRPLYLEAQFFESRPTQRFLGRECWNEINDDRLGRALDKFYEFGCDTLFASLASQAAIRYGISQKFRHCDSTSMSVSGAYESEDEKPLIAFGYSKDHRSDLKQFMIYMMSSQDGDVPLLAQTVAGNSSDKKLFKENLSQLKEQIRQGEECYFVADSALYTQQTIKELSEYMKWITRVPEKILEAKKLLISEEKMVKLDDNYQIKEMYSEYGGIKQRWLIVDSKLARAREEKTLEKRVVKEKKSGEIELKTLKGKDFNCKNDAEQAIMNWGKQQKYHRIKEHKVSESKHKIGRGRPKKGEEMRVTYRIEALLERDESKIESELKRKGKFIIATNELDQSKLSSNELLSNYKEQQSVERGFRFLKDPFFLTTSVFLKKQERIVALGMVMCLCLLVYTIAQRHMRQKLKILDESIPNQVGKATKKPTMRWIFQIFEGVHLLLKKSTSCLEEIILNLNEIRKAIIRILGPPFENMYASVQATNCSF